MQIDQPDIEAGAHTDTPEQSREFDIDRIRRDVFTAFYAMRSRDALDQMSIEVEIDYALRRMIGYVVVANLVYIALGLVGLFLHSFKQQPYIIFWPMFLVYTWLLCYNVTLSRNECGVCLGFFFAKLMFLALICVFIWLRQYYGAGIWLNCLVITELSAPLFLCCRKKRYT
jgi:hypothetical protein